MVAVRLLVCAAIAVGVASEPCCQGACKVAGEEKYYSVAKSMSGTKHCGECCMNPKSYNLYHLFEKNLTKADNDSPCSTTFGYTKYDSTATHGFGPVKMTLDLYDLPKATVVAASEPCCQGACKVAGEEKYYSVAKSMSGTKHCGECCMNPKSYNLYHLFEKNLTKADNDSPCSTTFGYTKYDSTATHGFGPVKMTLDLYDLPKATFDIVV